MLAHGTLPEKDEGPQRFLETFVPDEVVKTSQKMSDETNGRVGGGVWEINNKSLCQDLEEFQGS